MIGRKIVAITASTLALGFLTTTPAAAMAVKYSYSGADYSRNSTNGLKIFAHDGENDSHAVRADWVRTGTTSVSSVTNGGGPGTDVSANLATVVYRHRIVEVVPFANDDEGPWVYPS